MMLKPNDILLELGIELLTSFLLDMWEGRTTKRRIIELPGLSHDTHTYEHGFKYYIQNNSQQ